MGHDPGAWLLDDARELERVLEVVESKIRTTTSWEEAEPMVQAWRAMGETLRGDGNVTLPAAERRERVAQRGVPRT